MKFAARKCAGSFAASVLVLSIVCTPFAGAQSGPGSISGVVRDSSGGVLPGVTVKVSRGPVSPGGETVTDGDGVYRLSPLPAGSYRVEAALDGFETSVRPVDIGAGPAAVTVSTIERVPF